MIGNARRLVPQGHYNMAFEQVHEALMRLQEVRQ